MIRQFELVDRVKSYEIGANEDALNRAYVFSMMAHGSQIRESGDPYFSHPLEVAGILTELKLDSDTIVTGLLHDTVEDTIATIEEIKGLFGPSVARLVDGVTKLSKLEHKSAGKHQIENFRKLLLATSRDIRVLLVKLADRLHNMRTLGFIPSSERRTKIARETLEIFVPLAERIGMQRIKDELEDLAFTELYPDAKNTIVTRLEFLKSQAVEEEIIGSILKELRQKLEAEGLKIDLSGREKQPYSIWRKMQRRNAEFGQLSDIMAFRIVVGEIKECYQALGIIHRNYPCVPGRFKDYISTPKRNGYRSIHTGIIGPKQRRTEIQIRTHKMHQVADFGVAAHWQYKQENREEAPSENRWVHELLDILEHTTDPDEVIEHTRLDLFQEQVFCFTPKGDLIALPRGATTVDFAYEVHSEVGDACVGAKINGRLVPLRTVLKNGDQVEIVTSTPGVPAPEWEGFVVTGKARSRIRRFVRSKQHSEYRRLGEAMLGKAFSEKGYDITKTVLKTTLGSFGMKELEELYLSIGQGNLMASIIVDMIVKGEKGGKLTHKEESVAENAKFANYKKSIPIHGLIPGMAVHYASCCHPLPGDRIIGIQTPGKGVVVHTNDCETLESFHEMPERWVDISWDISSAKSTEFVGRLELVLANQRGGLASLTTVVANNLGNIVNLKINNRTTDFFEMSLDIEVKDNKHLNEIIAALRGIFVVSSVTRAKQ